jgi:hypothetical protein
MTTAFQKTGTDYTFGLPREATYDLYRINHGLPLLGHGPHRFVSTQVPYRKNKDYRPRFRNFVMGYPV